MSGRHLGRTARAGNALTWANSGHKRGHVGGTLGLMSAYQYRIGTDDPDYDRRVQEARAVGRITSMSGLGKAAFSHAMEHGQAATEALLRHRGALVDQDHDQLDRIEKLVTELRQLEPAELHQAQADRANWTTIDWIRADWAKAVALIGWVLLLGKTLPA